MPEWAFVPYECSGMVLPYVLSCGAARALGVQNLQIADCACALVGYARDALPIA